MFHLVRLNSEGKPVHRKGRPHETREAAESAREALGYYRGEYRILTEDEYRAARPEMCAASIREYIESHNFMLAPDYDDAKKRLEKVARAFDTWAGNRGENYVQPRPGFLGTEIGKVLMHEVYTAKGEKRRLDYGTYTLQEQVEMDNMEATRRRNFATALGQAAEAAYHQALKDLAVASLVEDESA